MASEAFYSTAAQVLPTLLIALVVEIGFITREWFRPLDEVIDDYAQRSGEIEDPFLARPELDDEDNREAWAIEVRAVVSAAGDAMSARSRLTVLATIAGTVAAMIAVGETFAILTLYLGADGCLPRFAGPICGATMMLATFAILGLALYRLMREGRRRRWP